MTYVNIPVNFEVPQSTDFEQFTKMMDVCAGQKVFVHCAANMRVSALYFCIDCGRAWTAQRLKMISKKFGNQTVFGGLLWLHRGKPIHQILLNNFSGIALSNNRKLWQSFSSTNLCYAKSFSFSK